jgi:type I restriction enzyme S subunit
MSIDAIEVREATPHNATYADAREVPPGYKTSEVGVIPADWDTARLGELGQALSGGTPRKSDARFWGGEIPWVSSKDMKVARLRDAIDHVTELALGNGTRLVRPKTILMVVRGMSLAHSFPVAIVEVPVAFNQDIKAFVPNERVTGEFLLRWLEVDREAILLLATEATHGTKRIPTSDLLATTVPLPRPAEQRAIAEALSDVDGLLGALDALIAKKRAIKQGAMQQLLTGKTRLPGFSGEWETKRLGEVAEIKTGPFGSALHERDYVAEGTPIITVEHLGESGVSHTRLPMVSEIDRVRLSAYSLIVGDIVFSRVGSIDRNALIRPPEAGWLFSGRLLRVRPDRSQVSSSYLSHHFHGDRFKARVREVAVGQTMASLNTRILQGIEVILPSLAEQSAIASVLSDTDAAIAALEAQRDKTRAIKLGMMQQLLTGRVRLVKPDAAA